MPLITKNPTSNETPDSGQGGLAVTSPTNTGHAQTTASASNGSSEGKTCRWSGFSAVGGQIKSVTLKVTHDTDGSLTGAGAGNQFQLAYSLNGGANWTIAVQRDNFTSPSVATFSVALSIAQDLTQVQVRDFVDAGTVDAGESANSIATVSDIRIEVVTVDAQVVIMM